MSAPTTPPKPTFYDALRFWFKLGWISFGGPAGQIAIMHTYLVEQKRWISEKKFFHALNYCMLLPGPEAQQLATYTGWLMHGTRGGLAAGILFVLPSALILLALSMAYVSFGHLYWVSSIFTGLKPAVVAIVMLALIKIGKRSLTDPLHYAVAVSCFIAIFFFRVNFPVVILAVLLFSAACMVWAPRLLQASSGNNVAADTEEGYYLSTRTALPHVRFSVKKLLVQLSVFTALWLAPFLIFGTTAYASFWKDLIWFFSQAAFITFGGAYAVLPYVAQQAVDHYHWLSSMQMIDGLALGETTPGPLIMVLAFVGFMGGWSAGGNSLWMGALGLFTTTYYTFLPCFLFIFAGAPLIERTQQNPQIKAALTLVTAAVTGVVMNLTVYFAEAVLFGKHHNSFSAISWGSIQLFPLLWIVISIIAMHRFKVGMLSWIGISAAAGWISWLIA